MRLTEQARAILLAEALGDLSELKNGVAQVQRALNEIAAGAGKHKEWSEQLEVKIAELNALRVLELANAPLQSQAERFMRALGADIKRVADVQVKLALTGHIERGRHKAMLVGLAVAFCVGVVVGTLI
ncbi:MAG: hypothetical protein ACOVSV_05980 [Fimbriimonadaceae bacterium]